MLLSCIDSGGIRRRSSRWCSTIKTLLNQRYRPAGSTSLWSCWWSSSTPWGCPRAHTTTSCLRYTRRSCRARSSASTESNEASRLVRASCPRCWSSALPLASSGLRRRCSARENSVNEKRARRDFLVKRLAREWLMATCPSAAPSRIIH